MCFVSTRGCASFSQTVQVAGITGFHHVADVARLFVDTLPGAVRLPGAHVSGIKAG